MNAIEILRAASRSVPNEDYVQFMAAVEAVEELVEASDELMSCPRQIDQATIPAGGIDLAPMQVVVEISASLARVRKLRAALANLSGGA